MPSDEAKTVKKRKEVKEEEEDEDDETCLGAMLENRKKKSNAISVPNSNGKQQNKAKKEPPRETKVKAEDEDIDEEDAYVKSIIRKISGTKPVKDLKKKKKKEEEEKEKEREKKEKKVYDLPGQKRDTPQERDPLRVFYETLFKQVPNSEMAQVWMMESGLLAIEVAVKVFEKKQKKKSQPKLSSPTKAVEKTLSPVAKKKPAVTSVSSNKKKSAGSKPALTSGMKRKIKNESSDEDSDDDFEVKRPAKKKRAT